MKAFLVTALILTAGVFFTIQSNSKATSDQTKIETLEGFVLEKPSFDSATQQWTVKLAVKKHKLYTNKALTISLPANDRKVRSYYMGDYVKLKYAAASKPASSQDLASEAIN